MATWISMPAAQNHRTTLTGRATGMGPSITSNPGSRNEPTAAPGEVYASPKKTLRVHRRFLALCSGRVRRPAAEASITEPAGEATTSSCFLTVHGDARALGLRAHGRRFPWIAGRSRQETDHESAFLPTSPRRIEE